MSRPLEPAGGWLPPESRFPMLLVGIVWGAAGLAGIAWVCGAGASWMTGHGWQAPPFGVDFARELVTAGPAKLWPQTPAWAAWGFVLWGLLIAALLGVGLAVGWHRHTSAAHAAAGMATRFQIASLLPPANLQRARQLRPSLPADDKQLDPAQVGLALGSVAHAKRPTEKNCVRSSWEDVLLAIMAPRSGKTTSLAVPFVLDAPGAVVGTSNKADLWAATSTLRAKDTGERVWTFDPQRITPTEQTWWWNPLEAVTTVEEASRLAGHFIQEIRAEKSSRDFWTSAAHDLLTGLLLAAAVSQRTLHDVYEWLNDPVIPTPAALLREHDFPAIAASLVGRQSGAPETRDGVYETARTAAQCLRDGNIMAWVTPPAEPMDQFRTAGFATSRQTLNLLSKDGAGAAAPLVAALTDRVMRDGVRAAELRGGRLDPPMVVVLDEAANVCRISDLPDLYSHLGSRGIIPVTVLQSYRQGVRVWTETGMDTLWSAATIKLIGAGVDDAKFAEDVSRLVGEHDVTVRSFSDGEKRRSTSTSLRRQRILPPDELRALERGTAILLATGLRVARLRLLPYYRGPRAAEIGRALEAALEPANAMMEER